MNPRALYESEDVSWLEAPDSKVESTWVERKQWTDVRRLAEQVSGFANGQPPGGLIVLGVTADGEIVGVDHKSPDELVKNLGSSIDGRLGKDWEHRYVSAPDKGRVLFVYVPFAADRVVCLSDGSAFRRVGESTVRLTPEQIIDLRDARGEQRFELRSVASFSKDLLDVEVSRKFLEGIVSRNHLTMPLTLDAALENKRLIVPTDTGHALTVAGAVVMGRLPADPIPGARLRFLAFEGTVEKFGTERNVIRDRWFDGALPKIVDDFHEFMGTQVRNFEYLGAGGTFIREPEYPEGAWQEAVVNALVHRSYTLQNAWVSVRMFDDRLEVESPGGYPGGNRPDEEGVFPRPYPRNPTIAGALQYLGLVWLAREGTRRMHDDMKKLGLPVPEFRDDGGTKVVVTLRNDLERRRGRTVEDASAQWSEVETLLNDNYAILRWRGLQKWKTLASRQVVPPLSLVDAAIQKLRRAEVEISVDQKRDILGLLQALPDNLLREPVVRLARDLVPSGLTFGQTDLDSQASQMVSRFDDAVDLVLGYLETQGLDLLEDGLVGAPQLENLLRVLVSRLHREPFPSKEWLGRVVAVSKRSKSPVSVSLYTMITGKNLA